MALTRNRRVQIDASGLARGQSDTFRALAVPFKGAPRTTDQGANYRRLADALGGFMDAANGLASLGAMMEKKDKSAQMDQKTYLDYAATVGSAGADVRAKYASETGHEPKTELYANITDLNERLLPAEAKAAEDARAAQTGVAGGWMNVEKPEDMTGEDDVLPMETPVTKEQNHQKWAMWLAENSYMYIKKSEEAGQLTGHRLYRDQIAALTQFAQEQEAKDNAALEAHKKWQITTKARSLAVDNTFDITESIDAGAASEGGATGEQLWDGLHKSAKVFYKEFGGEELSGKDHAKLTGEMVEELGRIAAIDTSAAQRILRMAATKLPSGADPMEHEVFGPILKRGLANAYEHLHGLNVAKATANAEALALETPGPFSKTIDRDITVETKGLGGEVVKKKVITAKEIIDGLGAKASDNIWNEGNERRESNDVILRKLIVSATERGYTDKYIKGIFAGDMIPKGDAANDEKAQQQYQTIVNTYQALEKNAPLSIPDYVKTKEQRAFMRALAASLKADPTRPPVVVAQEIARRIDKNGNLPNALAQRGIKAEHEAWLDGDVAKSLNPDDLEEVKQTFNFLYGDRTRADLEGTISDKLDAIATDKKAQSYTINGRSVFINQTFIPKELTREKFVEQVDEYVADMIRRELPKGTKLEDVKVIPLKDGTGFVLARQNSVSYLMRDGKEARVHYPNVAPYISKKYAPQREAERQRRENESIRLKGGVVPEGPKPPETPMDDNAQNPFAMPTPAPKREKIELPKQKTSGGRGKGQSTARNTSDVVLGELKEVLGGKGRNTNSNRQPRKTPKSRKYDITKPWFGLNKKK